MTTFTRRQLAALWRIANGLTYPWATEIKETELIFWDGPKPSKEEREEANSRFWCRPAPWTDERILQETLTRGNGCYEVEIDGRDWLCPAAQFTYQARRGSRDLKVTVNVDSDGLITVDVDGRVVYSAESSLAASNTFLSRDRMTATKTEDWTLLEPQRHLLTNGKVMFLVHKDATGAELAELGRALSGFGNEHVEQFVIEMTYRARSVG